MKKLSEDNFGNYLIRDIAEIELPESVSWLPQTLGWKILALLILLLAVFHAYRAANRWWRNRYRRSALQRLKAIERGAQGDNERVVVHLPKLLKATALHAYPRVDVAALSGDDWLAFLDAHYSGPPFRAAPGRQLLAVAYQSPAQWQLQPEEAETLISMCRRWLSQHEAHDARLAHA